AEILRELAIDRRDMHPYRLEYTAMHDRHVAAAFLLRAVAPLPRRADEAPGGPVREVAGQLIFQLLEFGADQVTQFAEPGLGPGLSLSDRLVVGHGHFFLLAFTTPLLSPRKAVCLDRKRVQ